jgi:hypothetical protein
MASKLEHPHFERNTRAGRRFLEDHRQRLAGQGIVVFLRVRLDVACELENLHHFCSGVVVDFDEVFVFHVVLFCLLDRLSFRAGGIPF